jgi:hypothetical protein
LERKWIGIDMTYISVDLLEKRLKKHQLNLPIVKRKL